MGTTLRVENLNPDMNDAALEQLFGPYGTVASARVDPYRIPGRGGGVGFVEMSTDVEARAAVAELDGSSSNGRTVTVRFVRFRASGGMLAATALKVLGEGRSGRGGASGAGRSRC